MSVGKKIRKTGILMLAAALFLGGCKKTSPAGEKETKEEQAMGRYVEEQIRMEADLGKCEAFAQLEDGRLTLFSLLYGPLISEDEGRTWMPWQSEWFGDHQGDFWLESAAIAPDGTMVVGYEKLAEEADEKTASEGERDREDAEQERESSSGDIFYQVIFPDGSSGYVELEGAADAKESALTAAFWFAPDGALYMTRSSALYEVSMDGEPDGEEAALRWKLTRIWEGDAAINQVCFAGNDLIAVNYKGAYIYDRNDRKQKEADEALDSFLQEKAAAGGNLLRYGEGSYNVYLCSNTDGMLYLACDEGIYAHRTGGGTIEKIADGTLCMLGDPSRSLYGMLASDDDTFLVLYQDMLGFFSYHEDIPAVPETELYVYSLKKDEVVQKAASLFTKEHPEVYVRYEIGMSENSGQTKEDLMKNLNTEILAGKGPDVLILDGFPMDTYMEKGLLADIGDVLEEAGKNEEFYENITGAFRQEEKLCAIPMRFRFPVIIGPAQELEAAESLDDFAQCVEALRQRKESGSVMGGVEPAATLELLALGSAAAWQTPEGQMDKDSVEEFLMQAKRIYRAESQGVSQEEKEEFEGTHFGTNDKKGVERDQAYMQVMLSALNAVLDENRIGIGNAEGIMDIQTLLSAQRQGKALYGGVFNGQSQNVFFPYTIAGVSSLGREQELAKQFVQMMLSEQAADSGSFSVNKRAVENAVNLENIPYNSQVGAVGGYDGNESYVGLDICQFSEAEEEWFYETLDSLCTPYLTGGILEEAVFACGERVLDGGMEVPDALEEIESRVKLALAERQ